MSCIHCYSPPLNLLTLHKQRHNAGKKTNPCCFISGYSMNKHPTIISQARVVPLKGVDFTTSLNLAVAKPANTQVLIQTSALMVFFYFIANFVVPQFLSESLQHDKVDERDNTKPKTDTVDKQKTSSTTSTSGFNSTKPK